jgi:hypothetical protein
VNLMMLIHPFKGTEAPVQSSGARYRWRDIRADGPVFVLAVERQKLIHSDLKDTDSAAFFHYGFCVGASTGTGGGQSFSNSLS